MKGCEDFVTYKVKREEGYYSTFIGLKSDKKGYYHKWISYNKFEDEMTKIPEGAKLDKTWEEGIEKYYCGSKKIFVTDYENCHPSFKGYKFVFPLDNGGSPFCVFYKEGDVAVFKMDPKYIIEDWKLHTCFYTKKVDHFSAKEVILGKSPKNEMTTFSGGYGKWTTGNSVLLWIKEDEYVYIGECIFRFKSLSKIVKYVSPIGNSGVPYPYAIDENGRYYLMIGNIMIEKVPWKFRGKPYMYAYNNMKVDLKKNINYNSEPGKNYDRMIDSWKEDKKIYREVDNKIIYVGMKKFETTREEYIKMNKDYGKKMGFSKLKGVKVIQKRIM